MPKNYYIGIGGTGARLAESLVHLCAAGLGPDQLTLFLIDPDQGNGNLARTTSLMDDYVRARSSFKDRAGDDVVAFGTRLRLPETPVWHVFDRREVRLSTHIGLPSIKQRNPALADFAKVLFSDDEMETPLDEGFRGHPNIGATVLSDVPSDTDPWRTFWQDVEEAQGPDDVNVFVSGSIFGGTGAAGIPTLGAPNVLKYDARASLGAGSKIRLGAGLVLPYFTFSAGAVRDGDPQMFVTSADFPIATKAALAYYADKDLAYDDVYLLGDSLAQNVGRFSPGNQNQKNRPHYIELTGALAALDFFGSRPHGGPTTYFHTARDNPRVEWDDLPVSRDADAVPARQAEVKERMASFAAFAYAVLGYGVPTLDRPIDEVSDAWHADHFAPRNMIGRRNKDKDPRQPADRQRIDAVAAYLARFVEWAATLDPVFESDETASHVKLFDGAQLMVQRDSDDDAVRVPNPEAVGKEHAIGTLLRSKTEGHDFTAFKNVLLATDVVGQPTPSVENADVFVNLFYRAARRYAEGNYKLQTAEGA